MAKINAFLSGKSSTSRAYAALAIGLAFGSFGATIIRFTQDGGIPSLVIVALRMALATLALTPFILRNYREQLRRLSRVDILLSVVAGFWIGMHFLAMFISLEHTTILVSMVLSGTSPLFVALLETTFLKTKLRGIVWLGLALAITGSIIIATAGRNQPVENNSTDQVDTSTITESDAENADTSDPTLGGLLAIGSAMCAAIYMVVGRKVRSRVSFMPFTWLVFGSAGIIMMGAVLITRTPITGYSAEGYFWLLVLTFAIQLISHPLFNYTLGYLPATLISISAQTIVISNAILAFLIFGEVPLVLQIIGSGVIVTGVILAIRGQSQPDALETSDSPR